MNAVIRRLGCRCWHMPSCTFSHVGPQITNGLSQPLNWSIYWYIYKKLTLRKKNNIILINVIEVQSLRKSGFLLFITILQQKVTPTSYMTKLKSKGLCAHKPLLLLQKMC